MKEYNFTNQLAIQIDNFFYEFDTYGYCDEIEDREENIIQIQKQLDDNKYICYIDHLKQIIREELGSEEDRKEAYKIIKALSLLL